MIFISFGVLLYQSVIEACRSWVFRNEAVSVFLQKNALCLGVVEGSGVTFSPQNLPEPSRMGNAGAQMQVAQILRFSLEVTQFLGIKKTTNQPKPRAGWDFWIQLHWPPFAGLVVLRSKEQDCFCSCGVLFPCSQPLATAGIEKGWECWDCWDRACLKPCAQLGHLYSWDFLLMLSACDPFHSFLQLQNKT